MHISKNAQEDEIGIGGKWTNEAARILWFGLHQSGNPGQAQIIMDHWNKEWFPEWTGSTTIINSVDGRLKNKEIDLAITQGGKILTLIELEETDTSRKKLRGDALEIMGGSSVIIDRTEYRTTPITKLAILFRASKTKSNNDKVGKLENIIAQDQIDQQSHKHPNAFVDKPKVRYFDWHESLRLALEETTGLSLKCQITCRSKRCEHYSRKSDQHQSRVSAEYLRARYEAWRSAPEYRIPGKKRDNGMPSLRDVADMTDIPYASLRGFVGPKGRWVTPNYRYTSTLSKLWGFNVIDFYTHGAGILTEEDIRKLN